jgi:hypothetical protein
MEKVVTLFLQQGILDSQLRGIGMGSSKGMGGLYSSGMWELWVRVKTKTP